MNSEMPARTRNGRRRDPSGHMDPFYQRRRRYQDTLSILGIWDLFAEMPRPVQQIFLQRKIPDPQLVFEDGVADGMPRALFDEVRRAAHAGFAAAAIEVEGKQMAVRDFFGIVTSCMMIVRHAKRPGFDPATLRFFNVAGPVLETCYAERMYLAASALYYAIAAPLAAGSRMDQHLLSARLDVQNRADGKSESRVVVRIASSQVRRVKLRGIERDVYRVGAGSPSGDATWLAWPRKKLGIAKAYEGTWKRLPVFIQKHALRRLHERVNLPTAAPYLEAWLEHSLSNPKVVERQGSHGQHLVIEYRIQQHRFGYLVCTMMRRCVVVRTFKFLTMSSTPEGKRLEKRLKITRAGVNQLGLDGLDAFTQTDLGKDPELSWLLRKCGVGHLFELKPEDYAPEPKAFAKDVKQYLKRAA